MSKFIQWVVPGHEPVERVRLLASLTRIDSDSLMFGVEWVLVRGAAQKHIGFVEQSHLNRALMTIDKAAGIVEKIKEVDWRSRTKSPVKNDVDDHLTWLKPGKEKQEKVELLLSLTNIRSKGTIEAITRILVNGVTMKFLAKHKVATNSNMHKALRIINSTSEIVEQIKVLDWQRFQK